MLSQGLTPIDNVGDGNCIFTSLAKIVLGDAAKYEFIRYMIVHRLKSFPEKYEGNKSCFSAYCDSMIMNGRPATMLELQAIADICFSVVECYDIHDFLVPRNTIWPLRFSNTSSKYTGCIRLWVQDGHCVALVNEQSQPLI